MRKTRNPNLVQIGRKGASGQICETLGVFLMFIYIFFHGLAYWSDQSADFDAKITRNYARMCLLGVRMMADYIKESNSPKPIKMGRGYSQSQPSPTNENLNIFKTE